MPVSVVESEQDKQPDIYQAHYDKNGDVALAAAFALCRDLFGLRVLQVIVNYAVFCFHRLSAAILMMHEMIQA